MAKGNRGNKDNKPKDDPKDKPKGGEKPEVPKERSMEETLFASNEDGLDSLNKVGKGSIEGAPLRLIGWLLILAVLIATTMYIQYKWKKEHHRSIGGSIEHYFDTLGSGPAKDKSTVEAEFILTTNWSARFRKRSGKDLVGSMNTPKVRIQMRANGNDETIMDIGNLDEGWGKRYPSNMPIAFLQWRVDPRCKIQEGEFEVDYPLHVDRQPER